MQNKTWIIIFLIFSHAIFFHGDGYAQQSGEKCAQIQYSKPKKGAIRYQVDRIEGQAVFSPVTQKDEFPAAGVCLVLFNEKDTQPIALTTTNGAGQFELSDVAPGTHTMIISVENDELKKIVLPLRFDSRKGKGSRRRAFLLHMFSKEDGRISFAASIANPALREELLHMSKLDQSVRNEMIRRGADHPDQSIQEKTQSIDASNVARLKVILKKYGWPRPGLVGKDGTNAAFLIVQHAADYGFQKMMLPLIRKEHLAGRVPGGDYALLMDRVLVREGKPQIYGTQPKPFEYWSGKEPVLYPIKDEANVDRRRAKLHLPPLPEYLEDLKKMYFPQNQK